ncbi:MAG TPA: winged helix-turn-helix domain-containing protein [Euzebyales bacterium]|nr:winged helix-turn-helix domain-containing protein [Euzebyales bacterium]
MDLTPLEFEVVHYLREREGTPVSRQEMLGDIWGYDTIIGSNVVDAVVVGLRRKLDRHADLIETVRGVGYRFRRDARD